MTKTCTCSTDGAPEGHRWVELTCPEHGPSVSSGRKAGKSVAARMAFRAHQIKTEGQTDGGA